MRINKNLNLESEPKDIKRKEDLDVKSDRLLKSNWIRK